MIPGPYSNFKYHSPVRWIQDEIKTNLAKFFSQIEYNERRDDFRVGYEAR